MSSYSDNESLFIQAAGGFDKRGRVFGMGGSASELKSSAKRSSSSTGVGPAGKRNTCGTNRKPLFSRPFFEVKKIKIN